MANVKFTEFPSAATVGGTDIIPIVQGGINKKATGAVFSTYIGSEFVALTGNQTIAGVKTFSSQLVSTIATGTAPFSVASTTKVTNLNADLLDGLSSAAFQTVLTNPITGTGTTNYLPKFTGASALGNSNLINDANGQLGLGVTPLNAYADSRALEIGANGIIWTENATSIYNSLGVGLNFYYDSAGNALYKNTGLASSKYTQYQGEHQWANAASGTAGNAISFTQAMTLDASGRLGIGITNPAANLHIKSSSAYAGIRVDNTGTTGGGFFAAYQNGSQIGIMGATGAVLGDTTSNLAIFSETGKSIDFMTDGSGTTKMRIASTGNVLIGTTTDAGRKLNVNGSIAWGSSSGAHMFAGGTSHLFAYSIDTLNVLYSGGANGLQINNAADNAVLMSMTDAGATTFSSSVTATQFTADSRTKVGGGYIADMGGAGNDTGIFFGANTILPSNGSGTITTKDLGSATYPWGAATFSGKVNIGNPVTAAVAVASTHKVEIVIGGTTYYLLATT